MRTADFERLLKGDFQIIENILSDGILAAYLLGFDITNEENQAKIVDAWLNQINLAEGDDEKKGKPVKKIGTKKLGLELRFDVPPKEAIDYFKRKNVVTKEEFNKLSREAKAAAFTIQGIYENDVLEGFKNEIINALESGQSQKFVVDKFKKILDGGGHKMLGDFHLETILREAMRTAHAKGCSDLTENNETSLLKAIAENAKRQLIVRCIILWKQRNLGLTSSPEKLRKRRLEWATKVLNLKNKLRTFNELNIQQLQYIAKDLK